MRSLLCVIARSAKTSAVDHLWLCHVVAERGIRPKTIAIAGRRLVREIGIADFAVATRVLLVRLEDGAIRRGTST